MRIIKKVSDPTDYYDNVQGYGFDPNCIFRRITSVYDDKSLEFQYVKNIPMIDSFFNDHDLSIANSYRYCERDGVQLKCKKAIIFCGKLYPLVVTDVESEDKSSTSMWSNLLHVCYTPDQVDAIVDKHSNKKQKEKYFNRKAKTKRERKYSWRTNYFDHISVQEFFTKFSTDVNDQLIDLHFHLNSPIILINDYTSRNRGKPVITNPLLRDLQFFKIVDCFQASQELAMFISGVMGGQCPPMIEIEDKYRIAMHGYDEQSFRKRKKVKNG